MTLTRQPRYGAVAYGPSFFSSLLLACAAITLTACGGGDGESNNNRGQDHDHVEIESSGRLAILDSQTNEVNIIEIDTGERVGVFAFEGEAPSLYTSPDNRFALVVQRNGNRVNFIDGGLYTEDHGDHQHDYVTPPALSSVALNGVKPTHYTFSDSVGVIFNDGGDGSVSSVDIFSEAGIISSAPIISFTLENAMHGVAKRVNDQLFVTYRAPSITDTTLPAQIDRYAFNGETATFTQRYEVECPRLHGAGANASYLAFGCSDGVMLIDVGNSSYPASKLANPVGLVGTERIGTIEAHPAVVEIVGVAGNKLFVVRPQSESPYQPLTIAGDSKRLDQGFSHDGDVFFVLSADGNLHLFDTQNGWTLIRILAVIPAVAEGAGAASVSVSAADASLYVVSPTGNVVVMVDAETATLVKNIPLTFTPSRMTWVGFKPHADAHSH